MLAYISCIIAGAAMSIQGVMNTRLGEGIGIYEANAVVQGIAFALSVIAVRILGEGNFSQLSEVNKWYLLGGVFGIIITVTVMLGMKNTTPAIAVSVILISQLTVAAVIDRFGFMGTEQIPFLWNKYLGLSLMVGGMLLFKWK